jgi:hypothetical protein
MRTLGGILAAFSLVTFSNLGHAAVTGDYVVNEKFFHGELKIVELSAQRIEFRLYTVTRLSAGDYIGEIEGIASLSGNIALFRGKQGCRLTIAFNDDKAVVTGGDTCRYYIDLNGTFNGTYDKLKR